MSRAAAGPLIPESAQAPAEAVREKAERVCDYCGEPIEGEPVRRGDRLYCSQACAFEAERSADCGGRGDSILSRGVVEPFKR